ncbi:hypothetical protein DFJ77DRAFT_469590 [Powellomyces hirtus]|nr:hypothetical protein DFJ77DRAFT_469590 [Powellomyces hirtus]
MSSNPSGPPPAYEHAVVAEGSSTESLTTCQVHQWSKPYYPTSAYCLAAFFFPIGILCCLRMREQRCLVCKEERTIGEPEEDPEKKAQAEQAYRLGFAVGAVGGVVNNATHNV